VKSAFGVEHNISKRKTVSERLPDRVPDSIAAVTPGTVVRTYEESPRKHRLKAAGTNLGSKVAGGVAGGVIAAAAAQPFLRKIPASKAVISTPKLLGGKALMTGSAARHYGQAAVYGTGGSAGSTLAGSISYKKIRDKYKGRGGRPRG
jgi:hypothetical protein